MLARRYVLGNMVGFENLKIGSRVQTVKNGEILTGIVRYKGGLNTKEGDWVGVELDTPVGYTSGLHKGHRHFQCKDMYGIFIRPRKLFLMANWRVRSQNMYRSVNKESYVDETLFAKKETSRHISVHTTLKSHVQKNMNFHKVHAVGHSLLSAKTKENCKERRHHLSGKMLFQSSPSIPNYYVPRKVFRRMMERNDFGTSMPRVNTLY
ncbi:microtubule-associated protein ssm4-like [Xenia sp. Carnegie-2017]|uniref:microtubule-associated protein ssm4-like n=1 Tax=Xenia sp. Carnegie-2017 TaxID=2897299 RepID=UPI001F041B8E|nr:microtubule-associated protein ssm4-like [Xenia sp. Carnegie-2017]